MSFDFQWVIQLHIVPFSFEIKTTLSMSGVQWFCIILVIYFRTRYTLDLKHLPTCNYNQIHQYMYSHYVWSVLNASPYISNKFNNMYLHFDLSHRCQWVSYKWSIKHGHKQTQIYHLTPTNVAATLVLILSHFFLYTSAVVTVENVV